MSLRWKHPFTSILAGPTGCGKSTFVVKFLKNLEYLSDTVFDWIIFCYSEWRSGYKEFGNHIGSNRVNLRIWITRVIRGPNWSSWTTWCPKPRVQEPESTSLPKVAIIIIAAWCSSRRMYSIRAEVSETFLWTLITSLCFKICVIAHRYAIYREKSTRKILFFCKKRITTRLSNPLAICFWISSMTHWTIVDSGPIFFPTTIITTYTCRKRKNL